MQEKDETLTSKLSMGKVKISQPLISTTVPDGVCGQLSNRFGTPSPSESLGCQLEQPLESTDSPTGVSGQSSSPSFIPSPSVSTLGSGPKSGPRRSSR